MPEIKVSVTWKYTSPRQYKERDYTFKSQEHYKKSRTKMDSDHTIRKIIKAEILCQKK